MTPAARAEIGELNQQLALKDTALQEALALKVAVTQETEALKEQLARKDTAATEALTLQTGLLALLVQTYEFFFLMSSLT